MKSFLSAVAVYFLPVLAFSGLGALVVCAAQGKAEAPADPAPVKQAVRKVLDDQVAAWNKGDLKEFMAGYWNSPDLTFFSGKDRKQGWQAAFDRYKARYQGEGREMGKLTFRDLETEVVTPEHAWVRGRWQVVTFKETLGGLFTLILQKKPEGWHIVHDHTSG